MILEQHVSPTILFGLVILTAIWLFVYFWKENSNLPPGPRGLPFLGYLPFITRESHLHFAELHQLYGPIFSFRTVGGALVIVLHSLESIKEVLLNRSDEFIWKPFENNVFEWITGGSGISQEDGPAWKEQRKFFLQTAKNFGFGKQDSEEIIHNELRYLLEGFRKCYGNSTNVSSSISYAASNAVSQILFSRKFADDEIQFKTIESKMYDMLKIFLGNQRYLVGTAFKLMMSLSPAMIKARKARDFIQKMVDTMVHDHVRSFDSVQSPRDYVDAYLHRIKEAEKRGKQEDTYFTMKRLKADSMNIFIEGTESITYTTVSLLNELSKHPETQAKIQQELDEVIGRERLPSWNDRPKLLYLQAVEHELFRVAAPFTLSAIYSNIEETTIQGYRIPRRSHIIVSFWAINKDPTIYPSPNKFKAERFFTLEGKKIKVDSLYPFGLGKRSCIGESLARMEVFLFLAAILQTFSIRPGDTEDTLRFIIRA